MELKKWYALIGKSKHTNNKTAVYGATEQDAKINAKDKLCRAGRTGMYRMWRDNGERVVPAEE